MRKKFDPTFRPAMSSQLNQSLKLMSSTSSSVTVHTDNLKKVLLATNNCEVATYSINGKFKTGKSFMLNCMLKYLLYCKTHPKNWIEVELPNPFGCDGEASKCTSGIDVWSEPFFVDVGNGKQVAVVLLDTQGLFDDESPESDNYSVFGFSTLISSVLIYNVMNSMNHKDWQFMELLMAFNNEAGNSEQEDLLNLNILLRDWENIQEYNFGTHSKSNTSDTTGNLYHHIFREKHISGNILKSFNQCSVTALPYPGKKLAMTNNATASLGDDEFILNVTQFIESIFSPTAVLSNKKKIGGSCVTGNVFLEYCMKWASFFKSLELPTPQSVYVSTAQLQHVNLIRNLEKEFSSILQIEADRHPDGNPNIKIMLEENTKLIVQKFENSKLMGKEEYSVEYKEILVKDIGIKSAKMEEGNVIKLEEAKIRRETEEAERKRQEHLQRVREAEAAARASQLAHEQQLRAMQENLQRRQEGIANSTVIPVAGTSPQEYDVILGCGTVCLRTLVPSGRIRNVTLPEGLRSIPRLKSMNLNPDVEYHVSKRILYQMAGSPPFPDIEIIFE